MRRVVSKPADPPDPSVPEGVEVGSGWLGGWGGRESGGQVVEVGGEVFVFVVCACVSREMGGTGHMCF